MVVTADPDIATVRRMVDTAIARAEGRTPAEAPETTVAEAPADPVTDAPEAATSGAVGRQHSGTGRPARRPDVVTGGSVGNLSDGYAANQTDDLGATC